MSFIAILISLGLMLLVLFFGVAYISSLIALIIAIKDKMYRVRLNSHGYNPSILVKHYILFSITFYSIAICVYLVILTVVIWVIHSAMPGVKQFISTL